MALIFRNDEAIEGIKIEDKCFIISQYADDTMLTLKYSEACLKRAIDILDNFEKLSGLKVNFDKSEIMPLGPIKHNYEILLPESRINWCEGPIKSLGVILCHNTEELVNINYARAITKMETAMNIWQKRYLTLYGKIVVTNTFIISQLVYLMSVLPSPSLTILMGVNKSIFKFIWNNKPEKIKRDVMKLPKMKGGMSVPDVLIKNESLKIAWINKFLKSDNSWKVFALNFLKRQIPLDIFIKCNLNEQDSFLVTNSICNCMVKDIFKCWFKYTFNIATDIGDIMQQVIWYNSHLRIDNKVIINKEMIQKGIVYVHQLFKQNGELLNLYEFNFTYQLNIDYLTYYGITSAIPREWKQVMRDQPHRIYGPGVDKCLTNVLVATKVCKAVYSHLIEQRYGAIEATGFKKWEIFFGNNSVSRADWEKSFEILYRICKCTDIQQIQFKLLHYIVATNERLYEWKLVETDICVFCEEDIETIPHIFVECEAIKIFWTDLESWMFLTTHIRYQLNTKELIFGIDNDNCGLDLFNMVYLIAKRFIYKCKYEGTFPSLTSFMPYLRRIVTMEKSIAIRNNKYVTFMDKWQALHFLTE